MVWIESVDEEINKNVARDYVSSLFDFTKDSILRNECANPR